MNEAILLQQKRRTIRAEPNPLDKCTVVSIFQKDIVEVKHTIQPGVFRISKGTISKPALLVVGPSSWWREVNEDEPLLEIPVASISVANSVVNDYINGMLAYNPGMACPGLFYVPGAKWNEKQEVDLAATLAWIQKEHTNQLEKAFNMQKQWYYDLVKMADILWARTNGNPIAVDDNMRLAAQELGIKDKPWMQDFNTVDMTACPACGALRNPAFPICGQCRTIVDKKKFDELGLVASKG